MAAATKTLLTPRRLAVGALALGLVGVTGVGVTLYAQRDAIGVKVLIDYLAAHGVPASIHLDKLSLSGASGSVRLGPAGRPDLVAGRVEAQFGAMPSPFHGLRPPPLRSVSLANAVLRVTLKDGRLDFGTLQPLVDQAMASKGGGGPAPDLYVHNSRLLLATPYGPLTVVVDMAVEGGRVHSLHARLEPTALAVAGLRLAGVQGVMSGQATGLGLLHLSGAFSAERGAGAKGAAQGLTLTVEGVAPNGTAQPQDGARRLDASARLRTASLALRPKDGAALQVTSGDLSLDVDGLVDRSGLFSGRLHANGRAAEMARGGLMLKGATLALTAAAAHARADKAGVEADGPYQLALAASGGAVRAGGVDARLMPLKLTAAGALQLDRRVRLQAAGTAQGGAALPLGEAQSLARRAVGSADPPALKPLARALERISLGATPYRLAYDSRAGATLHLAQGLRLQTPDGEVTLQPHGSGPVLATGAGGRGEGAATLQVRLAGLPSATLDARRLRLGPGGEVRADGALQLDGDLGPAQGASLQLAGALSGHDGAWRFDAADCSRFSAATVRDKGATAASGVQLQACPAGGEPLLTYGPRGWTVRSELRDAAAKLPQAMVQASLDSASVDLQGEGSRLSGQVRLHRALVDDLSPTPRVKPLAATGALILANGTAQGRFALSLQQGAVALGTADVTASPSGGQAMLQTVPIRFALHGLQPADIVPSLAKLLPEADGTVSLQARYAWASGGAGSSSGEVSSPGLSFRSPAGRLDGVKGVVRLASLQPLTAPAGQSLTADKLETVIPLTDIHLDFGLTPKAIAVQSASADAAGGVVSLGALNLPLAPAPLATSGVLQLKGVNLQTVISTLNLSNSVTLDAKVDGRLPFRLQPGDGGTVLRIKDGHVAAEGPGMLTIAQRALTGVATAGAAGAQPNAVQSFAYQALENLAFTTLEADVASRAGGRLGVVFHVVGRHDPPVSKPTRVGLFALLRGKAFDKPLPLPKGTPIDLTLDTSLNLDDILNAYTHLGGEGASSGGSAAVQPSTPSMKR